MPAAILTVCNLVAAYDAVAGTELALPHADPDTSDGTPWERVRDRLPVPTA